MYISASAPDAPPFSDTTIGCFIRLFFWTAACIIRAIWSEAPPAPAATTISTGFVGSHASAEPVNARAASPAVSPAVNPIARICLLLLDLLELRLGDLACGRLSAFRKIVHRGLHAFLLHLDARKRESHFNACQRSHQHEVVEISQMPDAEHLAAELGEAGAERQVEGIQDHFAHAVGVVAGGHQD